MAARPRFPHRGQLASTGMNDLAVALAAATAGANVIRAAGHAGRSVSYKGDVDPVTETDAASEAAILDLIGQNRPDDLVLAEETGGADWSTGRVWIVDPVDGTVNFLHGIPHVGVSVGLWIDGSPSVGVVVDPYRNETFHATLGGGAHLNGHPIHVSSVSDIGRSLVVTGFPYDRRQRAREYAATLGNVLARAQGIRRFGAATLDFCWVASGRFEGYWEYGLGPWDAAAGILILSEAGGVTTDFSGGPYILGSSTVLATNGSIHGEMIEALR